MSNYYVALDRDGTIIKKYHYLSDPALVELLPGAADGLRRMSKLGLSLVVVTNQSPIGRGYFDEARLAQIHQRLEDLLAAEGIILDRIYYCPHTPDDGCHCRKPEPGMLHSAGAFLNVAVENCFMIGDSACDVGAGRRVGATTFLVKTGNGLDVLAEGSADPDYVVDDLAQAAHIIETRLIKPETGPSQGPIIER